MKTKGKLIAAYCRDYTIEGDNGRKYKVKGDVVIGVIKPRVVIGVIKPRDPDNYFEGAWFSKINGNYECDGTLKYTKDEFKQNVYMWKEV